jgi:hypothetical protein
VRGDTYTDQCDSKTPECSLCQLKHTRFVYSSEPNTSRFAALKSEHEQLKSRYNNLSAVYEQLKNESASKVSEVLERTRSERESLGLLEKIRTLRRSLNGPQPSENATETVDSRDQPLAGFNATLGRETSSRLNFAREVGILSEGRGSINLESKEGLDKRHGFPPSLNAPFANPNHSNIRASNNLEHNSRSHISVSHKVLLWPGVVRYMRDSGIAEVAVTDLQCIARLGSPWLLQRETSTRHGKLPCNISIPCWTSDSGSVVFPDLTVERVNEYSSAYFNTFNALLPLLNSNDFLGGVVARLLREGFRDDDPESVLALLVFALGQLAIEGVVGRPTSAQNAESSGFRGGTIEKPPGLGLFNEARRRIGMANTQFRLENVQIMLLQATYFEASAMHLDFWSSTSAASLACICLIKGQQINWTSSYGDLVSRAYWVCVLQERLFDLEFRMASTGIESLEDRIPLPRFYVETEGRTGNPLSGTTNASTADGKGASGFYFIAMTALSRLLRRADNIIHDYEPNQGEIELLWHSSNNLNNTHAQENASHFGNYSGPPTELCQELVHQLDLWRDALPQKLQWSDSDRFDFEEVEPLSTALLSCSFSPLQNLGPGIIDHNTDIVVAQLRTRFYHARFLICRPFIYKAIHLPQLMTVDDRLKCAFAIDAACLWPLSLAPPKNKKHLIPHLFSWTQNFLSMIFVLRMCRTSRYLSDICHERGVAEDDRESAISSMIRWLEDVRQVDGIAAWSIRVLGPALSS